MIWQGFYGDQACGPNIGGVTVQIRNDPAAAMPPIQLPSGFPAWQLPESSQRASQRVNGQHLGPGSQMGSRGLPNGGPTTGASPVSLALLNLTSRSNAVKDPLMHN